MDRLTDSLNTVTKKPYHVAIKAAMKLARAKMKSRYYSLTDSSSAYRIAMVLHPGLKLEYFRQHKWEDEWVEEAENLAREEYIGRYEVTNEGDAPVTNENLSDIDAFDIANLSVLPHTAHASEIDEYLRLPIETCRDPLKWWLDNQHVYPNLSNMAMDYLSIPGEWSPCSFPHT